MDEANIYVWDGNYYALGVTARLGLEDSGGMVRVGPVPQNRWFTTRWRRSRSLGRRRVGLWNFRGLGQYPESFSDGQLIQAGRSG
jgi:hypothetical protein